MVVQRSVDSRWFHRWDQVITFFNLPEEIAFPILWIAFILVMIYKWYSMKYDWSKQDKSYERASKKYQKALKGGK